MDGLLSTFRAVSGTRRGLGAAGECCEGAESLPAPSPLSCSAARCRGRRFVSDLRVRRERSTEGSRGAPEIVVLHVQAALLSENFFPALGVLLGLLMKASTSENCQPEGLAQHGQAWDASSNHSNWVVFAESFFLARLHQFLVLLNVCLCTCRYRHEIAHDGQRIYILGGGTSWTAYSLDKVK